MGLCAALPRLSNFTEAAPGRYRRFAAYLAFLGFPWLLAPSTLAFLSLSPSATLAFLGFWDRRPWLFLAFRAPVPTTPPIGAARPPSARGGGSPSQTGASVYAEMRTKSIKRIVCPCPRTGPDPAALPSDDAPMRRDRHRFYSITSSARSSSASGTARTIARAALRLMTSSNVAGCSNGSAPGWAPRRILSTWPAACRYIAASPAP